MDILVIVLHKNCNTQVNNIQQYSNTLSYDVLYL